MTTDRINTKFILAHLAYGVLLLVFGLAASAFLDVAAITGLIPSMLAEFWLVVPLSMLLVTRFYHLSLLGVALTGVVVTLLAQAATVQIYDYVARPAGAHISWLELYAHGRAMFFVQTSLVTVGAGIIWLVAMRRGPLWLRPRGSDAAP